MNDRSSRQVFEEDPYAADSDHEYEELEADRGRDSRIRQQAERYADVDATHFVSTGDEDVESMAPGRTEDRERLENLSDALDDTLGRDPEALAADDARRHAVDQDAARRPLSDFMDKTPLTADQIDFEAEEELDEPRDAS